MTPSSIGPKRTAQPPSWCSTRPTGSPTHAALGNGTAAEHYALSPRRWDGVLREPEYPASQTVRRVRPNGAIRWRGAEIYLTEALVGDPVGLVEHQDGGWAVRFGPIELGVIDHRGDRLRKPSPRPVDLWITLTGYPQPHRPNSHSNRYERIRKTVTHVAGQICHRCSRLLRFLETG